jgi:hypothetical protein
VVAEVGTFLICKEIREARFLHSLGLVEPGQCLESQGTDTILILVVNVLSSGSVLHSGEETADDIPHNFGMVSKRFQIIVEEPFDLIDSSFVSVGIIEGSASVIKIPKHQAEHIDIPGWTETVTTDHRPPEIHERWRHTRLEPWWTRSHRWHFVGEW